MELRSIGSEPIALWHNCLTFSVVPIPSRVARSVVAVAPRKAHILAPRFI